MLTSRRVAVLCTLLVFLIVGIVAVLLPPSLINSYPKTKQTSEPTDVKDVVITMERDSYISPSYSLIIYGNGTVIYEGEINVHVTGKQVSQISQEKVKELVDEFYRIDYFSLNDSYTIPVMDLTRTTTSITINGKTKSVYNYGNEAPRKLVELENKIDEITNSSKWVKPHPLLGNSHHKTP